MTKPVILAIDDDVSFLAALQIVLSDQYELLQATSGELGLQLLKKNGVNCVLLDVNLPLANGIMILQEIRKISRNIPVIMVTAEKQLSMAVSAIKNGAYDYLDKPVDRDRLLTTLRNALTVEAGERERQHLIDLAKEQLPIIGDSPAMDRVRDFAARVASSDLPVLITGDTGTGKDLIARLIHLSSRRAGKTFAKLNMASVPEELVESELFGHKRGAFTGAVSDRQGIFQLADGGTLFLDEIGLASKRMQGKILEAVENQEFHPVGSTQKCTVNVRIIAATNKNLNIEMNSERFLIDLYHRIAALTIHMPSLQERPGDIIQIADYYLHAGSVEHQLPDRQLSPDAKQLLMDYEWPGNCRELKGTILATLLFADNPIIEPQDILLHLHKSPEQVQPQDRSLYGNLRVWEREFILKALVACDYDIPKTAAMLGIHRVTMYKKIRALELDTERTPD